MFRVLTRRSARVACTLVVAALVTVTGCVDDTAPAGLKTVPPGARRTVSGATITVTNTNDAGAGSLRDAIASAADGSLIQFDPSIAGQTITLSSGALSIVQSLTIEGPVPAGMTISGGGGSQVFIVQPAQTTQQVTLRNLTITGGKTNNEGGGIYNEATLTVDHALVTGNAAGFEGGGIFSVSGSLIVTNSTVSGNTVTASSASDIAGGGIATLSDFTLTNSTVAQNAVVTPTGGLAIAGGIYSHGAKAATFRNDIVAGNTTDGGSGAHTNNCASESSPAPALVGTNMSDDATCGAAGADMILGDPQLASLANNGGPTRTMALLKTSPAIDAVSATDCTVDTDQRYVTRPQGAACDIGAYEFNNFEQTPLTIDDAVTVNPNTGVAVVTGTIACPEALSLTLHVQLSQPQRAGRVSTTVSAAGDLAVTCTTSGTIAWAIAITPPTGAFQNGAGSVAASTTKQPAFVLGASATAAVKLYWGHK